jgi:transposase
MLISTFRHGWRSAQRKLPILQAFKYSDDATRLRPKLSCRSCETIIQALMPALPIERGRPRPGLITHVVVSKFCDHTPLHRQVGISVSQGVELDGSTLADWASQALFLLAPLAEAVGPHVRASVVLHGDDTTVPALSPGLGKTKKGCLWVAVRDASRSVGRGSLARDMPSFY